jgi:hypothetical protein
MADTYTKAVLTVIALALIMIAARDMVGPSTAQSPTHVVLDQIDGNAFGQLQYTLYPLPVKVKQ